MIINTFFEWLVISVGIFIALIILFPSILTFVVLPFKRLPHPDTVNEWLRKIGL